MEKTRRDVSVNHWVFQHFPNPLLCSTWSNRDDQLPFLVGHSFQPAARPAAARYQEVNVNSPIIAVASSMVPSVLYPAGTGTVVAAANLVEKRRQGPRHTPKKKKRR